jgi:flagellar biosynthetic protein FlhB
MAEDDGEERSQEPTDKRKQDSREEGRVLTSKEAMVFAGFAMATGLVMASAALMPQALALWRGYLRLDRAALLQDQIVARSLTAFWEILIVAVVVGLPLALSALGIQWATGGLHFAPKALGFKPDKLDPLKGLGRMVSVNALVELVKSVTKVVLLGAVAVTVLRGYLPQMDRLWAVSPVEAAGVLGGALIQLMLALTLVLLVIGAADLLWQWLTLRKQMMMTFQEVKQESKEQNGSPEVKGRLRQLQMEASRRAARQRKALPDVANATAVITNPTHFAVAIRYVQGDTRAPVILAMGKGPMAQEIRDRARKHGVTLLRSPLLARALYFTGDIGTEIQEGLYAAVAAILAHVYRLDRGEAGDLPEIELPPELRFGENGRPEVPPDSSPNAG